MAHSVQDMRDSPSNRLRASLDDAEKAVLRLKAEDVADFLVGLDQMAVQFDTLEANGMDLAGERTRYESLLSRLHNQPRLVTMAAAQLGGLAVLRQKHPPATGEWWHLDEVETQQRRDTIRRLLRSAGVLVGILLAIYIALTYVFPPDPDAVLSSNTTSRLPDLAAAGEWETAYALLTETLDELTVEDVELRIWLSVVAARLGRQEEADAAFAQAQAAVPADKQAVFWSTVGTIHMTAGDLEGASSAAQEALAIDPNEAQVYFLLASLAEVSGDVSGAIGYFDKAFELASDSNPQLAVIARVRMGMLMQGGPQSRPITTTVPAGE